MIGAIGLSSREPKKKKKSNVLDKELTLRAQSRVQEAKLVFGSDDDTHPGVKHLFNVAKDFYVGGKLRPSAVSSTTTSSICDVCSILPLEIRIRAKSKGQITNYQLVLYSHPC